VPEIRSDFSISKEKQQQRKATAMMMLEGAFKMFVVGVAVCPKRWRKQKDR
jgi:predicted nucleic acid-binding Zn ribbon protein